MEKNLDKIWNTVFIGVENDGQIADQNICDNTQQYIGHKIKKLNLIRQLRL